MAPECGRRILFIQLPYPAEDANPNCSLLAANAQLPEQRLGEGVAREGVDEGDDLVVELPGFEVDHLLPSGARSTSMATWPAGLFPAIPLDLSVRSNLVLRNALIGVLRRGSQ